MRTASEHILYPMALRAPGNFYRNGYSALMVYRDENAPATKGDLHALAHARKRDIRKLENRFDNLENSVHDLKNHFSLVAENLAADFRAITKDEIEVLKDALIRHDRRISSLEERAAAV
jgi:predicted phage-related endonuclease